MSALLLRPMTSDDWPAVERIYAEGIATGDATFETATPTWSHFDGGHHAFARLVAVEDSQIVGWAALSPVSSRRAYAGVAEVSVYVAQGQRGRGVGQALLQQLVRASEAQGLWTLQASIMAENEASIRLHARCGFRVVGRRERIGRRDGAWRDTIVMERRSPRIE